MHIDHVRLTASFEHTVVAASPSAERVARKLLMSCHPSTNVAMTPITAHVKSPSIALNACTRLLNIQPKVTYKITHTTSPSASQSRKRGQGYVVIPLVRFTHDPSGES